jgi:hypothetical protein
LTDDVKKSEVSGAEIESAGPGSPLSEKSGEIPHSCDIVVQYAFTCCLLLCGSMKGHKDKTYMYTSPPGVVSNHMPLRLIPQLVPVEAKVSSLPSLRDLLNLLGIKL